MQLGRDEVHRFRRRRQIRNAVERAVAMKPYEQHRSGEFRKIRPSNLDAVEQQERRCPIQGTQHPGRLSSIGLGDHHHGR